MGPHSCSFTYHRECEAWVCGCGRHEGAVRCYCGWTAAGYREMAEWAGLLPAPVTPEGMAGWR